MILAKYQSMFSVHVLVQHLPEGKIYSSLIKKNLTHVIMTDRGQA